MIAVLPADEELPMFPRFYFSPTPSVAHLGVAYIPKGPKLLKHLLRRCFEAVFRVK